ncbi:MAG: class I SAM-dependent methyltransferase, partial [Thermoguttaceae bacterium]
MYGKREPWGRCALCLTVYVCAAGAVAAAPSAVEEIVRDSGVAAGLVVHLGTTDGQLETALAQGGRRLVHGLAADEDSLRTARKTIEDAGLYGLASVIAHRGDRRLPYRDNLVDLLVVSNWDTWAKKGIKEEELLRVVAPQGVLCLWRDGKWQRRVKPRPAEMDEWRTHRNLSAGTFISRDAALQAPFELRWVEGPRYGSDPVQPPTRMMLSAGGTLYALVSADVMNFGRKPEPASGDTAVSTFFMRGMKPVLAARNAYNGIRLWSSDKSPWNVPGMCAAGPFLFEAQGAAIAAYDGASGEKQYTIRSAGQVTAIGSDGEALYVTA